MNVFIDRIMEGEQYVFMLSSGHAAITGRLVEAGALLVVSGYTIGASRDEENYYYLNPAHVVGIRPA